MEFRRLVNDFLMYESEKSLFDLQMKGIQYWQLIRFDLLNELLIKKEIIAMPHRVANKNNKFRLNRLSRLYKALIKAPFFIQKKDVLIFETPRKVKVDGFYTSIYTDKIVEELDHDALIIESPGIEHFKTKSYKITRYFDLIEIVVSIRNRLNKICKISLKNREDELAISKLMEDISNQFSVEINSNRWIENINISILAFKTYSYFLNKIFNKISPKIILLVNSYSIFGLAVCYNAKKYKIPVVELQHGTMGKYHIAYNFINETRLDMFPDYIFVFGEYWKDITRFPLTKDRIKVVGWPFYEKRKISNLKYIRNKSNTILFISQGTIGFQMSKIAVKLSQQLSNEYKIIYKLHPGEFETWETDYPWLKNERIVVVSDNKKSMDYYFVISKYQVGVTSTSIFEGLGYGLVTIILKLGDYVYMEDLLETRSVLLANDDKQLLEYILNGNNETLNFDFSYFWASDSLNKMKLEINTILEQV